MQTRRAFLVHSSRVAAAAAVTRTGVVWALPSRAKRRARWLGEVTHADFVAAVATTFNVEVANATSVPLKLLSVTDRTTPLAQSHLPDAHNEKFTLVLSGASELRLEQDTYHFTHRGIGEFDMFITPLSSTDPENNLYEAIFNRARPVSPPVW